MTKVVIAKATLGGAGLVVGLAGMVLDADGLVGVAIGLLGVAFLLRFIKPKPEEENPVS